jgi:hypothetical protein
MATMTKTNDAVTKAMAKAEAAELAFNAASQAVIDAERAMVLAKEARYSAQREAAAAAVELEKARAMVKGDEVTADIDFNNAKSSYSGRAGACCCGCAGNHSETPVAIKRQINRIKRLAAEGVELDIQPSYVAAEKDGRLYIVYLAE